MGHVPVHGKDIASLSSHVDSLRRTWYGACAEWRACAWALKFSFGGVGGWVYSLVKLTSHVQGVTLIAVHSLYTTNTSVCHTYIKSCEVLLLLLVVVVVLLLLLLALFGHPRCHRAASPSLP